jgi:DNA (cytosine-5)-methyltransferase 1
MYCGAGGATRGYQDAGWEVVGVDIATQRYYCGDFFYRADCRDLPDEFLACFDAVHASPPCQFFTQMSNRRWNGGEPRAHPDLLTPTLERLRQLTVPWVVENVPGAAPPLRPTLSLHGGMFGLGVNRIRLFESNVLLLAPRAAQTADAVGVYGKGPDGRMLWKRSHYRKKDGRILFRAPRSLAEAQEAMGMDWADWHGTKEAIPPAYTRHIGEQLMFYLRSAA